MVLEILVGRQNDLDQLKFGRKLELILTTFPRPWGSKSLVLDGHGGVPDLSLSDTFSSIGVREEAKLEVGSSIGLIR